MNSHAVDLPEGALFIVLESIGTLVWRKFQQRHPDIMIENRLIGQDRSKWPPFAYFRFESDDQVIISRLRELVQQACGDVAWRFEARAREGLPGSNLLIEPACFSKVREHAFAMGLNESEYLMRVDPSFGPKANTEFLHLVRRIESAFGLKGQ